MGSSNIKSSSIIFTFKEIVKEGGFKRLYRGILPPIAVEAPKRAVKFAANEQFTKLYTRILHTQTVSQPLSILVGMTAGISEAVLVVPFELVKIRLQDSASVRDNLLGRAI